MDSISEEALIANDYEGALAEVLLKDYETGIYKFLL
jgi:hypothetical protein